LSAKLHVINKISNKITISYNYELTRYIIGMGPGTGTREGIRGFKPLSRQSDTITPNRQKKPVTQV